MHNKHSLYLFTLLSILFIGLFAVTILAETKPAAINTPIDPDTFEYANPASYNGLSLTEIQGLHASEIARNYETAKSKGILDQISFDQAKIITVSGDSTGNWNLNHFSKDVALAIVKDNTKCPKLNSLPDSLGDGRFYVAGGQLIYGDKAKITLPKEFSGAVDFKDNTFILKPDAAMKMPKLAADEKALIEATKDNSVEIDGISITTSMTVSGDSEGSQRFISKDTKLEIIKGRDGISTIKKDGKEEYKINAKITVKEDNAVFLSATGKDTPFYVEHNIGNKNVRAELNTGGTFELGGKSDNRITFDSKSNDVSVYAKERVTLNVDYNNGQKKVSNVVLGGNKPASVQIGFREADGKVTSRLTRLSGEIQVSGITINEKGVFTPANLKGKGLIDGLPDEMVNNNKPAEVWITGSDGNNVYSTTRDGNRILSSAGSSLSVENLKSMINDDVQKKGKTESQADYVKRVYSIYAKVLSDAGLNPALAAVLFEEVPGTVTDNYVHDKGSGDESYGPFPVPRGMVNEIVKEINTKYGLSITANDLQTNGALNAIAGAMTLVKYATEKSNTKKQFNDVSSAPGTPEQKLLRQQLYMSYVLNTPLSQIPINEIKKVKSQSDITPSRFVTVDGRIGNLNDGITALNSPQMASYANDPSSPDSPTSVSISSLKDNDQSIKGIIRYNAGEGSEYYKSYRLANPQMNLPEDASKLTTANINDIRKDQSEKGFTGNWVDGKIGPKTSLRTEYSVAEKKVYDYAAKNNIKTDGRGLSEVVKDIQVKILNFDPKSTDSSTRADGILGAGTLEALIEKDSSFSSLDNLVEKRGITLSDNGADKITSGTIVTDSRKSQSTRGISFVSSIVLKDGEAAPLPEKYMDPKYIGDLIGASRGNGRKHAGVDIAAPSGTPIYAMQTGTVYQIKNRLSGDAGGYYITIRNTDGSYTSYMHLNAPPSVSVGQTINAGTQIAQVGRSGAYSTTAVGAHLHIQRTVGQPYGYSYADRSLQRELKTMCSMAHPCD